MTKQDWANEINKVIANERNEYARSVGAERAKIKQTIVMIDFRNGDVLHFFRHLAQAVAA